jgi:predicted ATPase/class 3 adenylate cyclase
MTTGIRTFLFTDIEGSTAGLTRLGDAAYSVVLEDHHRIIRSSLQAFGGVEQETRGDSFFAVFASPSACVAAALQMQRDLRAHHWPASEDLRVRMGIHTGEASEASTGMVGYEVHRAARIAAVGYGGQVLISSSTMALVQDSLPPGASVLGLGSHRLKDLRRPEVIFQLIADDLHEQFPPLRSLDNPQLLHNLPELVSSFVGRETEVIELRKLVETSRLVTLSGAGGSGKTRLALQVAAEALDDFADGAWLVELASLADAALVTSAVASVLGVREEPGRPLLETLVNALSDRHLLVILDNCEHVLAAAAKLADTLLRSCPRVSVLATSREPLGIAGERAYRVPSLSLPGPDQVLTPDEAGSFDAVRLFADRAVRHRPDFLLDDTNAAIVASLCRKLDGMPLAIELAAARLGSLSVADIEQRLDDRFGFLTRGARTAHPRQQTLHALIDWSYDLLDETEQTVLCRLSVFAGGWTLGAAEAVCSGDDLPAREVADILGSLVDKSLVQADPMGSDLRYRLLETIRQYAAEKLSHRGATEVASAVYQHAEFFLNLAKAAASHLRGPAQAHWFDRLELEHDNLRVAMAYFLSDHVSGERSLRLGIALRDFWVFRGYFDEGIEGLEPALAQPETGSLLDLRAAALLVTAALHYVKGEFRDCRPPMEEGLATARQVGDLALIAQALRALSSLERTEATDITKAVRMANEAVEVAILSGDPHLAAEAHLERANALTTSGREGASSDFDTALSHYRTEGNRLGVAQTLSAWSLMELKQGEFSVARSRIEQALGILDELQADGMGTLHDPLLDLLTILGLVEILDGNPSAANRAFTNSLTTARRMGIQALVAYAYVGIGFCATVTEDHDRAARLQGAADLIFERMGTLVIDPALQGLRELNSSHLRQTMGTGGFEREYEAGRTLAPHAAFTLALEGSDKNQ